MGKFPAYGFVNQVPTRLDTGKEEHSQSAITSHEPRKGQFKARYEPRRGQFKAQAYGTAEHPSLATSPAQGSSRHRHTGQPFINNQPNQPRAQKWAVQGAPRAQKRAVQGAGIQDCWASQSSHEPCTGQFKAWHMGQPSIPKSITACHEPRRGQFKARHEPRRGQFKAHAYRT